MGNTKRTQELPCLVLKSVLSARPSSPSRSFTSTPRWLMAISTNARNAANMTLKRIELKTLIGFALTTEQGQRRTNESSTPLRSLVHGASKTSDGPLLTLLWLGQSKAENLCVNHARFAVNPRRSATMTTTTNRWM